VSQPIIGYTNQFEFATVASPTTFTALAGVNAISLSGDKVASEKTTVMSATSTGVDSFVPSTQDPGSCDVKGLFYPGDTTQTALEAIRVAGSTVAMKVTYGTSNSCTFYGFVESFTPAFPLEKPATFDLKIKITATPSGLGKVYA
jgi:hypothetical protein